MECLDKWLAHPPIVSKDPSYIARFPSLHLNAEVWTSVWSPKGRYLASAGEVNLCIFLLIRTPHFFQINKKDQTTKLWDIQGLDTLEKENNKVTHKEICKLTGHTTAVTCVDWTVIVLDRQKGEKGKELFATCADDRTVMVWEVIREKDESVKFEKLFVFAPDNVLGWFTFTYMRFLPNGDKLVAGTENGYICTFDVVKMKQLEGDCLHRGSIEGLECNENGTVVTCASDMTVGVNRLLLRSSL